MQIASRRHYPKGFVPSSVLGFLGPISDREFLSVQKELSLLEEFLRDRAIGLPTVLPKGFSSARDVKERYFELKNKSYTLQSKVGKAGIEAQFDEELRGLSGKKKYEVDIHGNIRHELPESYAATPGRRFILSISSELQEFAETLLIESEISRHDRFGMIKDNDKVFSPWIKGGVREERGFAM